MCVCVCVCDTHTHTNTYIHTYTKNCVFQIKPVQFCPCFEASPCRVLVAAFCTITHSLTLVNMQMIQLFITFTSLFVKVSSLSFPWTVAFNVAISNCCSSVVRFICMSLFMCVGVVCVVSKICPTSVFLVFSSCSFSWTIAFDVAISDSKSFICLFMYFGVVCESLSLIAQSLLLSLPPLSLHLLFFSMSLSLCLFVSFSFSPFLPFSLSPSYFFEYY